LWQPREWQIVRIKAIALDPVLEQQGLNAKAINFMYKSIAILGFAVAVVGITPTVSALPSASLVAQTTSEDLYKQGIQKLESKEFHGAIAKFTQVLKANPNNADSEAVANLQASAYLYRGFAQSKVLDIMGAIEDFKEALRLNPSYGDLRQTIEQNPKLSTAYNLLNAARSQHFTAVIEQNPNNVQAYFYRGLANKDSGDNQQAIADLTKVIRFQPKNAEAYLNRGIAQRMYDANKALSDFNKAIRLNPKNAEAYLNRGLVYSKLGKEQQAISDFDTSIGLKPDYTDAYLKRYSSRKKLGDTAGAIADLTEAIRLKPNEAAGLYAARGDFRLELKDTEGALADYTEAIRLAPDITSYTDTRFASYMAYRRRANVRYELQDYEGAIDDYSEVIRLAPNGSAFDGAVNSANIWADAYYRRAQAHEKLGDKEDAIEDYQKAAQYYQERGLTAQYEQAMQQIRTLQQ
jgi:tetratricopeptide (TPR) repeat protein